MSIQPTGPHQRNSEIPTTCGLWHAPTHQCLFMFHQILGSTPKSGTANLSRLRSPDPGQRTRASMPFSALLPRWTITEDINNSGGNESVTGWPSKSTQATVSKQHVVIRSCRTASDHSSIETMKIAQRQETATKNQLHGKKCCLISLRRSTVAGKRSRKAHR